MLSTPKPGFIVSLCCSGSFGDHLFSTGLQAASRREAGIIILIDLDIYIKEHSLSCPKKLNQSAQLMKVQQQPRDGVSLKTILPETQQQVTMVVLSDVFKNYTY